ncbi:MAG TPA: zinc ribbon domain-containing protein [Steroidobacteraceae bacterium]|nr:zinc ribbon domain-containing protein [Steroidobacteraceae bacterium]
MPFYEYQCGSCGHHLEVLQKISDAPLKKCPDCGKSTLKRLISAPVFRLKGGGWYETDFKSDKENKRNLAGAEEPAGEAKAETKAEASKTESKAEPAAKAEPKETAVAKPAAKTPAKPAKKSAAKPAAKKKARR